MTERLLHRDDPLWWRTASIYQVYVRSFADGDGDGVGDVAGLRARLPYLRDLGVDAVWLNPWYVSPMADGGYDVADFRDIDPVLGTLEEGRAFIEEAHGHGIRVILDIVPNHVSDRHAWFRQALAAGPGAPERELFLFRDGRGPDGDEPPNNWRANFGGPAWTRTTNPDGTPGQWYLHLFAPEQPDLNWEHPDVHEEFRSILRFWFDLGVDGFRIDVAHGLVKDPLLPDFQQHPREQHLPAPGHVHPYADLDGVHEIYRDWRRVADSYDPPRIFVAEAWVPTPERLSRYLRADELHTAFNFHYLQAPWTAEGMRASIDASFAALGSVGAPVTWVLSNHDVVRHVSRFGRPDHAQHKALSALRDAPLDLELGTRRARAAALLSLALPGNVYLYQGEELGLWEVEDLPPEVLQDPTWERSERTDPGRDGCRVPLPWSGQAPPFGFGDGAEPWLPQPAGWAELTAERAAADPDSMLSLYRNALRLRSEVPGLAGEAMTWVDAGEQVLAFDREGVRCVVNLGTEPVDLPEGAEVLLASDVVVGGRLPRDTAAWVRLR
ncbi:glycoside hydrolase family 13 protein [Nocardiopsis sp. MG754419]|uniref:glycoside hydrolase family 13 protein n=1 Tax=Nocardiopsis sp. MG754419 TaxID=2259865 RepID=UPI001BA51215|nr:glycoside hydrolase family 13 protein [Nocardiopsis sp. MG754419]MBR8742073.1 alpha-glucosidase [Nocardiopsis sp. MG754419]